MPRVWCGLDAASQCKGGTHAQNTLEEGVLCGRATWQSGITAYAEGGKQALTTWLKQQGVQNIEALNAIVRQGAQPWWNLYGGKDHLDSVDSFSLKRSLKSESGQ